MRKRKLAPFIFGLGIGVLLGFAIRNSETTDYNAGYQPNLDVFDEKDYFTDAEIGRHAKGYKARKKAKEKEEGKSEDANS